MARTIRDIPFTEIVEKVQDMSKSASKDSRRIRGVVNDVRDEINRMFDWPYLKSGSSIACIAKIDSGVALNVTTQGTVVTLSGIGVNVDSSFTGRKIKFDDNPNVYDFTHQSSTGGTINPPLSGVTNISNGAYKIFKDVYTLAGDFDRFPINGGLLAYQAGIPSPLPELVDDDYYAQANASPTSVPDYCRPLGFDTAGNMRYQIIPPPSTPYVLQYEYVRFQYPMKETTAGTIVMNSASTTVSGTGTLFTEMNTGDYLRINDFGIGEDSRWYKIQTITSDTNMTLSTSFRSDTDGSYSNSLGNGFVISSSPQMPYRLQEALILGSMRNIILDQNDPSFQFYHMRYAQTVTDSIVIYKTRRPKDEVETIAEDYNYRR